MKQMVLEAIEQGVHDDVVVFFMFPKNKNLITCMMAYHPMGASFSHEVGESVKPLLYVSNVRRWYH